MQYLPFGTLPEGCVETESIFMSIAAVGSSLMAYRLLRCLCRVVTPEAGDEEGSEGEKKKERGT